jgi:glutaredoxin
VQNQEKFELVIYTHSDCAFSAAAKVDFNKRQISYLEIELSRQPEKIPELLKLTDGERITPVIVKNGQIIIGFKGAY